MSRTRLSRTTIRPSQLDNHYYCSNAIQYVYFLYYNNILCFVVVWVVAQVYNVPVLVILLLYTCTLSACASYTILTCARRKTLDVCCLTPLSRVTRTLGQYLCSRDDTSKTDELQCDSKSR